MNMAVWSSIPQWESQTNNFFVNINWWPHPNVGNLPQFCLWLMWLWVSNLWTKGGPDLPSSHRTMVCWKLQYDFPMTEHLRHPPSLLDFPAGWRFLRFYRMFNPSSTVTILPFSLFSTSVASSPKTRPSNPPPARWSETPRVHGLRKSPFETWALMNCCLKDAQWSVLHSSLRMQRYTAGGWMILKVKELKGHMGSLLNKMIELTNPNAHHLWNKNLCTYSNSNYCASSPLTIPL